MGATGKRINQLFTLLHAVCCGSQLPGNPSSIHHSSLKWDPVFRELPKMISLAKKKFWSTFKRRMSPFARRLLPWAWSSTSKGLRSLVWCTSTTRTVVSSTLTRLAIGHWGWATSCLHVGWSLPDPVDLNLPLATPTGLFQGQKKTSIRRSLNLTHHQWLLDIYIFMIWNVPARLVPALN